MSTVLPSASSPAAAPFMLLFRNAGPETHAHLTPEQKTAMAKQWNDWGERLVARGQMQHGHPLGLGGRVVSGPAGARVTDGPYAEAKEAVGGFFSSPSQTLTRPPRSRNSVRACPSASRSRCAPWPPRARC